MIGAAAMGTLRTTGGRGRVATARVLLASTVVTSAACTPGADVGSRGDTDGAPTASALQAAALMDRTATIAAGAAQVTAKLRFETADGSTAYTSCLLQVDDAESKVQVRRSYVVGALEPGQAASVADRIRRSWEAQGWKVVQYGGASVAAVDLRHPADDMTGSLLSTSRSVGMYLVSPCLWVDGVPGHVEVDAAGAPVAPEGLDGSTVAVADG